MSRSCKLCVLSLAEADPSTCMSKKCSEESRMQIPFWEKHAPLFGVPYWNHWGRAAVVCNRTLCRAWQGIKWSNRAPAYVIGVSCSCEISSIVGSHGHLEGGQVPAWTSAVVLQRQSLWLNTHWVACSLLCWFVPRSLLVLNHKRYSDAHFNSKQKWGEPHKLSSGLGFVVIFVWMQKKETCWSKSSWEHQP